MCGNKLCIENGKSSGCECKQAVTEDNCRMRAWKRRKQRGLDTENGKSSTDSCEKSGGAAKPLKFSPKTADRENKE